MGGSTKVVDTTPKQTQGLRTDVIDYLSGKPRTSSAGTQQGNGLFGILRARENALTGTNPSGGGPQPGAADPFDRIRAESPELPPQINIPQVGPVEGFGRDSIRDIFGGNVNFDPSMIGMIDPNMIPGVGNNLPSFMRKDIGNVGTNPLGHLGTDSVDQLGGANSAFFQNMMKQLQPAFDQRRTEGIAAAREGAGNLTGTGLGNSIGTSINRSLGDEQATLANYAAQGLQTEVGRQLQQAGINTNRDISSAGNALQAGIANQGADQNFMSILLNRAGLGQQGELANQDATLRTLLANQGAGIEGARLGLQAGQGNQEAALRASMANQGADQNFMSQELQRLFGNQGAQIGQNQFQGNMDQQRQMQIFQTLAQLGDSNAQRFMQMLLGQSTAGVAPGQVTQSGGIGSLLGPLGGIAGTALGGPLGGALGSKLFGGSRTPSTSNQVFQQPQLF